MWKRLDSVLQTHIHHCIIDRKHFEVGGSVENIHQPCVVNTGLPIGPTATSSGFWRAPAANQDFVPYACSILQLCSHSRAWLVQHLVHLWVFCSNQRKGLRSQGQQYVWTVCYLCVCDGDVFYFIELFVFVWCWMRRLSTFGSVTRVGFCSWAPFSHSYWEFFKTPLPDSWLEI